MLLFSHGWAVFFWFLLFNSVDKTSDMEGWLVAFFFFLNARTFHLIISFSSFKKNFLFFLWVTNTVVTHLKTIPLMYEGDHKFMHTLYFIQIESWVWKSITSSRNRLTFLISYILFHDTVLKKNAMTFFQHTYQCLSYYVSLTVYYA